MQKNTPANYTWNFKTFRLFALFIPLIIVSLIGLFVLLQNNGVIDERADYWRIQTEWFFSINAALSTWPAFWYNMTQLGDALVIIPLLSFLVLWRPQAWAAMFGTIPLALLLAHGGKALLAMPRPAAVLNHDNFSIVGSALTAHTSLPSGHTITVFAALTAVFATLISQPRKRRDWILLFAGFLVAVVLSLSRVAVGAHWPLDVATGAFLGISAGLSGTYLTQRYKRWWQWIESSKFSLLLGGFVLLLSASLLQKAYAQGFETTHYAVLWIAGFVGLSVSLYLFSRFKKPLRMHKT
ncbi:MAG: phosphatase PAP2 family protein [Cocleimonas sp.]